MQISRRWFIGGLASLGAMGGIRGFAAPAGTFSRGRPRLRFGVVSDIHFRCYARTGDAKKEADWQTNVATFLKTLEWFRDQKVDGVMIAGDMADNGMVDQLQGVADCWYKVFPDDKAPDGRKVEKLFTLGNHDWEGGRYGDHAKKAFPDPEERARHLLRMDLKGHWQEIFHEDFSPVYLKTVKGYSFVGAHWTQDKCKGKEETGIAGVQEFFAENGAKLDPKLPFFYFQHPHPKGTCYGEAGWGQDDGRATRALSAFPNAIAFSGHSHATLTNEKSIWQGAFTSLGTSSLRYTGGPGVFGIPKRGFENVGGGGKVMKPFNGGDGRQGMLVSVYDDRVVFARRDFVYGLPLGDDWVLPLPAAEKKPFDFSTRTARSAAPQFPAGAALAVTRTQVAPVPKKKGPKSKPGEAAEPKPAVHLVFPAANAVAQARAYIYEVVAQSKEGEAKTFQVLAQGYNMGPAHDLAKGDSFCTLAAEALPPGPCRFAVLPVSSLGKKGRPLTCDYTEIS